jgi:hypothetical protein
MDNRKPAIMEAALAKLYLSKHLSYPTRNHCPLVRALA